MGLFSKKPKAPEIDLAVSEEHKKRFREIFSETVPGGEEYQILYGYSTTSKFERGFVFNTNPITSTSSATAGTTGRWRWCR